MPSWILRLYYSWRLRQAHLDQLFWMDEVERVRANAGVVVQRVEYWRRRLHDARYPLAKRLLRRV